MLPSCLSVSLVGPPLPEVASEPFLEEISTCAFRIPAASPDAELQPLVDLEPNSTCECPSLAGAEQPVRCWNQSHMFEEGEPRASGLVPEGFLGEVAVDLSPPERQGVGWGRAEQELCAPQLRLTCS